MPAAHPRTEDHGHDMKVSVTDLSPCRRSVSVELPPDVIQQEYEKAFREFARGIRLDGFRKGHVPKQVVEQRFGKEIEQEVVEHLIRDYSSSALEESGLEPLHTPVLKDYKFGRDTGLSFVTEFEVRPRLEVSGYKGLKVPRREVEVKEADLRAALDELRERAARFEAVEGRGIEAGDHILADVNGSVDGSDDGPFSNEDVFFEIGSAGPHPELTDELRGMKPGEERSFGVKYPQDHPNTSLAGRRVVYSVKLKEIKNKILPELDDDFARSVGSTDTLDKFRERVREDLVKIATLRERDEARKAALDQLHDANAGVEVPESLVDDQVEGEIEDAIRSISSRGMDPRNAGVDWDEIRKERREPARRFVRGILLLDAIAGQEKMEADPAEVDAVVEREAARRKQSAEALRARWEKEGRLDSLKRQILREKVLDFLLAAANI